MQLLDKLRRKGDYYHNIRVLQEGKGQIVTCRQPTQNAKAENFLPCSICFGFFQKSELLKHEKTCHETLDEPTDVVADAHATDTDDVSLQVKNDPLICQFADRLLEERSGGPSKDGDARQEVTMLGRFLLAAKSLDPEVQTLHDVLVPSKFALALNAVNKACCSSTSGQWHESSTSIASEVGLSLKAACDIAVAEYDRAGREEAARSARDFSDLLDADWHRSVSRRASLEEDGRDEKEIKSLTKDVVKLQKMLTFKGEKAKQQLLEGPNPGAYKTLSKILLSQITLFNGRRQGEVAAMPLQTYMNGAIEVPKEDFMQYLSPLEKNFIEEFAKFVIRGEGGETVLVLLTKEMKESLDFLVDQRSAENCILDSNRYVFARQNSDSHLRGSSCLRKHAAACEAKKPKTLTSAQMRLHVATLSQIINLDDNDVDQLANLMGDDVRKHRNDSCLKENSLLLAKMSKRLMAMENASDEYNDNSQDEIDLGFEGE